MFESFENLSEEKKNTIINACINEFGKKGYSKASTNCIVKEAGISKGILFHYFGNKKSMYLYILDYASDYYLKYMLSCMNVYSDDLFDRILDWSKIKIKISEENPVIYRFFASAFIDLPEVLRTEIAKRYDKYYKIGYSLLFDGIDMSKFRDDIDKRKAVELILLTFDGLSEKCIKIIKSTSDMGYDSRNQKYEEIDQYVSIMRKIYYKQE